MLNTYQNRVKERLNLVKRLKTRKIWVILGTIILGAIGSGIWELALKPSLSRISRGTFNLITLGIKGLSDRIYLQISTGINENTIMSNFTLIPLIFFCTVLTFITLVEFREYFFKILNVIIKPCKSDTNNEVNDKKDNRGKGLLMLITIIILTFSIITSIRNIYVSNCIVHYKQLITITSPYISAEEKEKFNSNFAQIQNSYDYKNIITRLEKIADNHNLKYIKISIY